MKCGVVWKSLFVIHHHLKSGIFKGQYHCLQSQRALKAHSYTKPCVSLPHKLNGQLNGAEQWCHLHKVCLLGSLAFPPQGVYDLILAHHVTWPHCAAYGRPLWLDKLSPGCIEIFQQQNQGTSTCPSALLLCTLPHSECLLIGHF